MKLAIIVLAYHKPRQLARLLRTLEHPHVQVYLHLDSRTPMSPFAEALDGIDGVSWLPRHPSGWGSAHCVDAALEGLRAGAAARCDYFILISGQDFLLRTVEELLAFAEAAGTRSYVGYRPLPDPQRPFGALDRINFYTYTVLGKRVTCVPWGEDASFLTWPRRMLNGLLRVRSLTKPDRRFPPYARPFLGYTWWNLSAAAADHILSFLAKHPDYREYHEHTSIAEEVFLPSILLGTDFAERYEVVNDYLRFEVWPRDGAHPVVLRQEHLSAMLASSALFARKFDADIDSNVLACLSERLAQ